MGGSCGAAREVDAASHDITGFIFRGQKKGDSEEPPVV